MPYRMDALASVCANAAVGSCAHTLKARLLYQTMTNNYKNNQAYGSFCPNSKGTAVENDSQGLWSRAEGTRNQ